MSWNKEIALLWWLFKKDWIDKTSKTTSKETTTLVNKANASWFKKWELVSTWPWDILITIALILAISISLITKKIQFGFLR